MAPAKSDIEEPGTKSWRGTQQGRREFCTGEGIGWTLSTVRTTRSYEPKSPMASETSMVLHQPVLQR
ncbi:unnamed protein product [Zymoseptoria tritici ST99CH_3D7]|uniref:Uncharacterized protein n=1 Tax=Zymoseptoria tritici (strain ST99CH_3D7) TaxID=1276538 RepID=A0A1X7RG68_ZYMT9|nr:unnamed protein product [Zymoseptoria tritici ST99CH_3D7]